MDEQGIHVFVTGKVQGVYYRETTRKVARQLGVSGWVRNLRDGRVELKAFACKNKIDQLLTYCRKGPILARVLQVEVEPIPVETVSGFQVIAEVSGD
jgi:acylphosphatase